jgi:negative regulator of sigma E activity
MDPSVNTGASDQFTRVFVSYAREDKKWLDVDYRFNLIPFLMESLKRQNVVFWFDKDLKPGDEFRAHIEAEIDQSQIALLIVSQAFLNSEFIEKYEMSRIVDRTKIGKMIIVPVLVEPCEWSEYPILADRQMVPGAMPLIDFTESDPKWARVKVEILDGLKTQIKRIRGLQSPGPSQDNQKSIPQANAHSQSASFFEELPVQPRATPRAANERAAPAKNEESKPVWQKVPAWMWGATAVVVLAVVFAAARLAGPHPQPVVSPQPQPASAPPAQPAPTLGTTSSTPDTQPPVQRAPSHAPAPPSNAKTPPQNSLTMTEEMQADSFFNSKNYAQAEPIYFKLCMGGNGPSCNRAGYLYQNGFGVKANASEAANLYTLACNANFPNGCSNLGNLYRQGLGVPLNPALAKQFLTKGCNAGNQFGCDKLKLMK